MTAQAAYRSQRSAQIVLRPNDAQRLKLASDASPAGPD